jgi:PAS domain S-box-containing protein
VSPILWYQSTAPHHASDSARAPSRHFYPGLSTGTRDPQACVTHGDEYRIQQYDLPDRSRKRGTSPGAPQFSRRAYRLGIAADRHQGMIAFARRVAHPAVMGGHERPGMESELSRVVDMLPGLVWTALPDGQVDFLNQRWCQYTGLSIAESCGGGWQTAIHPEDLPEFLESWRSILASCEPGEMEARLRRLDGEYRWFLFRTCPIADASGQIVKWCGINTDIDDRRRVEEALRAQEHRFRSIADGYPALVAMRTPAGDLEFANRRYREYFGATLEELKSRATADTIHPDDLPNVIAAWKKAVETGLPCDIECRGRVGGVYRWFHTHGFPLRDTEGRIVLCLVHTDIDDRKRAEAMLAGENRLLEMVARGHPMSTVLQVLCQLVESTVSECYCSVLLVDPSGTRLEHGVAPSLPASFISSVIGRPVNVDSGPCAMAAYLNEQVIAADLTSETRWAASEWRQMCLAHGLQACWSTPILSTAGKALGTFAIYYNEPRTPTTCGQSHIEQFTHIASIVVERAQNDAALKRSEAFLAEAQRLSSTGSFSFHLETEEFTWSEQLYRIFELEQGVPITFELIGSRIHPDDRPLWYEKVDRARSDRSDFEDEHRLQLPDRSIKYLHVVAHVTQDQDGQLEYVGAIQDVTERQRSEEALAKVQSELAHVARVTSLGALTASIAHEVNQPLSGIITNANTCLRMLSADPPNVDGARETARRTIRDGNRASDVITRLRALFSKKHVTSEPVDLNEATREVITLLRSELQRSRVILRAELADDLPPVTGDRVQLQQVILNLLRNASDAMSGVDDRLRKLVIRTERDEDDRVRLAVQDTGLGFEPQAVGRLFDSFYTTKNGGMGIGLSVSRSIIESHRGRLWAAPNDGPGATFSFSIPSAPNSVTDTQSLDAIRTPVSDAGRAMRNS